MQRCAGDPGAWHGAVAAPRSHGSAIKATEPAAIRNGTTCAKAPGGVTSSSTAPVAPPAAVSGSQRFSHGPQPASSRWEPCAEPGQQAFRATRLVALALSGGSPSASRAG